MLIFKPDDRKQICGLEDAGLYCGFPAIQRYFFLPPAEVLRVACREASQQGRHVVE
jgi:hypothetical protein